MGFETYFREQLHNHPSAQPRDVVKLCYQAAFGAEHLLQDIDRARAFLLKESEETKAKDIPLWEPISVDICRVNLAAWKYHGMPVEWLFQMFAASFGKRENGESLFWEYLKTAGSVWKAENRSAEELETYLSDYMKEGLHPVHHSDIYREAEQPAYRIVDRKFEKLFPILRKVAETEKEPCIIAIDGRAASGKTTMSGLLKTILQTDVVQMDDFFLPLELRTEERLQQPGGNVHYERFAEEVLPYLKETDAFAYGIFDCGRMDYHGRREIGSGHIRIVEGSYSCHPFFGEYADIRVFSDVAPEEQMQRILKRNGEQMAEMFRSRWIPMEEAYFKAHAIKEKADICLK